MSGVSGGGLGRLHLIEQQEVSAPVAEVDFLDLPIDVFGVLQVNFFGVLPVTDSVQFEARLRQEGGAFAVGLTDYSYHFMRVDDGGSSLAVANASSSVLAMAAPVGALASEGISGRLDLLSFASPAVRSRVRQSTLSITQIGSSRSTWGGGHLNLSAGRVDGLRLRFASGNIAAGVFQLFGIKGR